MNVSGLQAKIKRLRSQEKEAQNKLQIQESEFKQNEQDTFDGQGQSYRQPAVEFLLDSKTNEQLKSIQNETIKSP